MATAMEDEDDYTLDEEERSTPLHALRYSCIRRISMYLNQNIEPRPGMRLTPNFGGLAELIGLEGIEISDLERQENPGFSLLSVWKERIDLKPTVGNLVTFLQQLGREDILTDTIDWIRDEIKLHRERQRDFIQCETVTSSSSATVDDGPQVLTIHDVCGGVNIYDAFICYDGADVEFVKTLLARLENPQLGFRCFVPGRDSLIGMYSHDKVTRIISERCRHMIVVLSESFVQSEACEFQTAYAFALNPGARDQKIIPIKIEPCAMPGILQIMATCDFNSGNQDWSWQRLVMSLMSPMPNQGFLGPVRFVPPAGSRLANLRTGMAEMRSTPSSSQSQDSGFSSYGSRGRSRDMTSPISSQSSPSNNRQPSGSGRVIHTAPALAQETPLHRERSPGTISQVFKKLTPLFSKKSKSTEKLNDKNN